MKTRREKILIGRRTGSRPPPHSHRVAWGFRWFLALAVSSNGLIALPAAEPPPLPPLTTVSGSPRLPGKFVRADLVTDDALVAQKFYTALFGSKFYDCGGYLVGMNDDRPLCGIFQRPRPPGFIRQATVDWPPLRAQCVEGAARGDGGRGKVVAPPQLPLMRRYAENTPKSVTRT